MLSQAIGWGAMALCLGGFGLSAYVALRAKRAMRPILAQAQNDRAERPSQRAGD